MRFAKIIFFAAAFFVFLTGCTRAASQNSAASTLDPLYTQQVQTAQALASQGVTLSTPAPGLLPPGGETATAIPGGAAIAPTFPAAPTLTPAVLPSVTPGGPAAASAAMTSFCDAVAYIADVTVPDGTDFAPNTAFTKTWRLKNVGTCTWTPSYSLTWVSGDPMSAVYPVALTANVPPGGQVDLSANMVSPASPASYQGNWELKNASGQLFGIGAQANQPFWVKIDVVGPASVGLDFVASMCAPGTSWSSGAGALACPGTSGNASGYELQVTNPQLENGTTDTAPGLLTVPQNIANGYIMGTYPEYTVKSGDHFKSIVNCQYGATGCDVFFQLQYQVGAGVVTPYWQFHERYEGLYYRTDVDLSPLAGQTVKFILRVVNSPSTVNGLALWGAPRIESGGGTTPPPPSTCTDKAAFIADVTVPDNTVFAPNTSFTKTWRLKNVGTCTWTTSYKLTWVSGDPMSAVYPVALTTSVAPGGQVDVSANLVSPAAGGSYQGNWMLQNASGTKFGIGTTSTSAFWVLIKVSGGATVTPPPAACDRAAFVADVTVPDGTVFAPNTSFTKTWRLKNVGTCTWTTSYKLTWVSGDPMSAVYPVALTTSVAPGGQVDVSANLVSPAAAGAYQGNWMLQNASGTNFGIGTTGTGPFWVKINVSGGTPPPSSCTDKAAFVADVTVPDYTTFAPNTSFTKTWRLKNVGTCTWTSSYKLTWVSGDPMSAVYPVALTTTVAPGGQVDVSANLVSPATSGTYTGNWMLQNASGTKFGVGFSATSVFWVKINVSP